MSHNGGGEWVAPNGGTVGKNNRMGPRGHYAAGLFSLLVTIGLLYALYPMVVAVTNPLHVLSSTAIVTLWAATWVVLWGGLEVVVDNRLA